eukprot:2339648-Amphidinium_carterae.1
MSSGSSRVTKHTMSSSICSPPAALGLDVCRTCNRNAPPFIVVCYFFRCSDSSKVNGMVKEVTLAHGKKTALKPHLCPLHCTCQDINTSSDAKDRLHHQPSPWARLARPSSFCTGQELGSPSCPIHWPSYC